LKCDQSDYQGNLTNREFSDVLDEDEDEYDNASVYNNQKPPMTSLLREEDKPAGLRNVGNTCWFNSIIQTFFHLPYFRRLIFSFQIDEADMDKLEANERNVVKFVVELRKLFALMLKSKRKAINPNLTLRYLTNCSKYDVETFNQEDVSEFATILVNLIEESFDILFKLQQQKVPNVNATQISCGKSLGKEEKSDVESLSESLCGFGLTSSIQKPSDEHPKHLALRKNRKNPIVNLLNGDILIYRKNTDENITSSLIEIFREVNIQMLNARNLHAGLEMEWGETSIDKSAPVHVALASDAESTSSRMKKSSYEQETWVVKLPSVLFICLNRYKFSKDTQSSSKILEPFEFYPHIYLDR
jgi:ubiquitin carboxyl-terminal hydrolase 25/28